MAITSPLIHSADVPTVDLSQSGPSQVSANAKSAANQRRLISPSKDLVEMEPSVIMGAKLGLDSRFQLRQNIEYKMKNKKKNNLFRDSVTLQFSLVFVIEGFPSSQVLNKEFAMRPLNKLTQADAPSIIFQLFCSGTVSSLAT